MASAHIFLVSDSSDYTAPKGCGPTGLMLAQLLKFNGALRIVIAAPGGPKLDLAKKLDLADEYVELERGGSKAQWEEIKQKNPYGFDAVVSRGCHSRVCRAKVNSLAQRLKQQASSRLSMMRSTTSVEEGLCSCMGCMRNRIAYM